MQTRTTRGVKPPARDRRIARPETRYFEKSQPRGPSKGPFQSSDWTFGNSGNRPQEPKCATYREVNRPTESNRARPSVQTSAHAVFPRSLYRETMTYHEFNLRKPNGWSNAQNGPEAGHE